MNFISLAWGFKGLCKMFIITWRHRESIMSCKKKKIIIECLKPKLAHVSKHDCSKDIG